jgi:hypothetical protein
MNLGSILDGLMRSQGSLSGRPQQGGLGGMLGGSGGFGSQIPGGMGGLAAGSLLSLILGSRGGRSAGGSLMKACLRSRPREAASTSKRKRTRTAMRWASPSCRP